MAQKLLDINQLLSSCIKNALEVGVTHILDLKVDFKNIDIEKDLNVGQSLYYIKEIDLDTIATDSGYNNKMHRVTDIQFYAGDKRQIYTTLSVIFNHRAEQVQISIYTIFKL